MVLNHSDGIDEQGKSLIWAYVYHSPAIDSTLMFMVSDQTIIYTGELGWEPPSKTGLPDNWLDSQQAIAVAEQAGGQNYRQTNQDVFVGGWLSRQIYPLLADSAVWGFNYYSSTSDPMTLFVDAVTGELLSDISVELTAQQRLADVLQAAQNWAADAVLTLVSPAAPLEINGVAAGWVYVFYSSSKGQYRNFYATSQGPIGSEAQTMAQPPSNEPLPTGWINSDIAMAVAEANGGGNYRAANSNVLVVGSVSKNILSYYGEPSKAVWRFLYGSSTSSHFIIYVDAESGAFIPQSDPILTTARYNLEAADYIVAGFSNDAALTYVMNNIGTIASDGTADGWLFTYYSAAKDSFVSYQIMSGYPAMIWDFDGGLGSKDELPENWLNSDQVISIADANGGTQFRTSYGDARVQGLLTLNYPGGNYQISPETPVWRIQYSTSLADTFLIVLIHALNGAIIPPISAIEEALTAGEIPETFALSQNYPNRFNNSLNKKNSTIEIINVCLSGGSSLSIIDVLPESVLSQPMVYKPDFLEKAGLLEVD